MVGVEVRQPALGESGSQLGVRRAADPEGMPGAEDIVVEPRLRELGRAHRAAQLRLTLEDGDAPAGARQERRARKRVDAASDENGVVVSHARARGTRRP